MIMPVFTLELPTCRVNFVLHRCHPKIVESSPQSVGRTPQGTTIPFCPCPSPLPILIGRTPRASYNNTLLRRVLEGSLKEVLLRRVVVYSIAPSPLKVCAGCGLCEQALLMLVM